jgi:succinate-semialdehyde dehydrogenase/glutarate-semialdehyde dehydrogenase
VHEQDYPGFCDAFVEATAELKVGDGSDPSVDVGPLANSRRPAALASLIDEAVEKGARIAIGGGPADSKPGYFFAPTVLVDVPESARIMQEEPFGPVALLTSYSDSSDVIARANGTPFGLAAYVVATDPWAAQEVASHLDAGMVGINHFALSYAGVPFGGVKSSGIGTESGSSAMDAFLTYKSIHHRQYAFGSPSAR